MRKMVYKEPMRAYIQKLENFSSRHGFYLLRLSVVIVYIWFGALKLLHMSPITNLIIGTYPTFPEPFFIYLLGVLEIVIGICLVFRQTLRAGLVLLFLQMGGIFFGVTLAPSLYFSHSNLFLLTASGEFVAKNFILLAAALVLFGKTRQ